MLEKSASIKVAPEKTCVVSMGKEINTNDKIDFLGTEVKVEKIARYLGLLLGQDCNIDNHVNKQAGKIRARAIGCEKMSKMGNPIFAARSFVNISDGLSNYALPVCKLESHHLKTLENARNDGIKTCRKLHYKQIGRPINQIEIFDKIGNVRSIENNLKFLSVSIVSTIFQTQKPADLYKTLKSCLKVDGAPALSPNSFNLMTPKEKSQNWAIFWEKIRAGQYGPKIEFSDDLTTDQKNDKNVTDAWPYCIKENFNSMPPMIRGMVGTYAFQNEARGWFTAKCQHFFTHKNGCKYCKLPRPKMDLNNIKGPFDGISEEKMLHMMKMCADTKNAWKLRKKIKVPVEDYWPKRPIRGFTLDYDTIND